MASTGTLFEDQGEVTFKWKIKGRRGIFFSPSDYEIDERIASPRFYCCGTSWEMGMYPNGQTEYKSEGWIGLHLTRMSSGFPLSVSLSVLSLGFKKVDGNLGPHLTGPEEFDSYNIGIGKSKFMSHKELNERKSEIVDEGILTVTCTMKNSVPIDVSGTLFNRLQCLTDNLYEMYKKRQRTDLTLKVGGEQHIAAHRIILEARSPALAALFNRDGYESDKACINDADKDTMKVLFDYIYTADFGRLTVEDALSVYAAAEKFDMKEVKDICLEFIMRNLSEECVCDVIKFAEQFEIKELSQRAREYFREVADKIVESDKWITFKKENHDLSVELQGDLLKRKPLK